MKGKISKLVYIYLIPKDKWPKHKIYTFPIFEGRINVDRDLKGKQRLLGFEFLDCYGVEIDGKKIT